MQVIVLANEEQKAEWSKQETKGMVWVNDVQAFLQYPAADTFVDLLYENTPDRNAFLVQLLPTAVIINSVADTLRETNPSFVRMNGWPTFLASKVIEATCENEDLKKKASIVFSLLGKTAEWLPDTPGFVTARVVSMIINEAYLALAEGVSSREEINTAMKLGTAYPYGPFEWAEKIGLKNVVALLQKLSHEQLRYIPAELLLQEARTAT